MSKPQRTYHVSESNRIAVGTGAVVSSEQTGRYVYITTEVLWFDSDTGVFETKNTVYVPAAQ